MACSSAWRFPRRPTKGMALTTLNARKNSGVAGHDMNGRDVTGEVTRGRMHEWQAVRQWGDEGNCLSHERGKLLLLPTFSTGIAVKEMEKGETRISTEEAIKEDRSWRSAYTVYRKMLLVKHICSKKKIIILIIISKQFKYKEKDSVTFVWILGYFLSEMKHCIPSNTPRLARFVKAAGGQQSILISEMNWSEGTKHCQLIKQIQFSKCVCLW